MRERENNLSVLYFSCLCVALVGLVVVVALVVILVDFGLCVVWERE